MRVLCFVAASLLLDGASSFAVGGSRAVQLRGAVAQPLAPRAASPLCAEYSTKVKITAETRAPLRQARIFFLYPSMIAGASIAAYVSFLRVIGQQDALTDAGNLVVNFGVIAAAVFFAKQDLDGREQLLKEVAVELGEQMDEPEESSPPPQQ